MKKDRLSEYIFAAILVALTFFNFIVPNNISNRIAISVALVIYTIVCRFFVKTKRVDNINKKTVIILMVIFGVIYVLSLYVMGIFASFYQNPLMFSFKVLVDRIIPYIMIIICSEVLRGIFIPRDNKFSTIFITIALILLDVGIYNNLNGLNSLEDYLTFFGYMVMSSVSVNLLCNYIAKRYGALPNILYRVITVIYAYIFPLLPDIYLFFQTTLRILYPYVIYLVLDSVLIEARYKTYIKKERIYTAVSCLAIAMIIGFVLLVSCKFKYGIIAIGSSSMSDEINKGDAVIFEQYDGQSIKEGKVIVFNQEGRRVVHRVTSVEFVRDKEIYYTKGDANQEIDDGYREKEDIIGIVNFKINDIGWPVIWLNEVIHN